jgi:hypothetical protein
MPLGWRLTLLISPIGSGMAASCSQPSAMVSMTLSVRRRRSTMGAAKPAASAAAISRALASCKGSPPARSKRASSLSAEFLARVAARAISAEAARAWRPRVCM